jgi:Plasmid stabilisation system protein.
MLDHKIEVSDRARQMLTAHVRFLAEVNVKAAEKVRTEVMAGIRSLKSMPERGPFLVGDFIPPNKYHKLFIENWYLILYQIRNQTVYIEYIIDCRQDYSWLLR